MTIEDLERGMKLLFDQQVQFADDLVKLEQRQEKTDQQLATLAGKVTDLTGRVTDLTETIGEITGSQTLTMKAITSVVAMIGDLTESQKRTDAIVATLSRRIDAFIAAQGNGHKKSP